MYAEDWRCEKGYVWEEEVEVQDKNDEVLRRTMVSNYKKNKY